MKIISILLIGILSLLLVACDKSYVIDTHDAVTGLQKLDRQYDDAVAALRDNIESLTPEHREALRAAHKEFNDLRAAVHLLLTKYDGVPQAVVQLNQVKTLFQEARESYHAIRNVLCPDAQPGDILGPDACPGMAALTENEVATLVRFDEQARQVGQALKRLEDSPDGANVTRTLIDILQLGTTAIMLSERVTHG